MPKHPCNLHVPWVLVLVFLSSALGNQAAVARSHPQVDAATKKEVVETVAVLMRDHYVFPDIGDRMGQHIKTTHEGGGYDHFNDLGAFCSKVTADLREISNDKHLFVFYSPEEAREVAARNNLLPPEEIKSINDSYFEMDRRANFGFGKLEILPGNVGYLELSSFSGSDQASETAIAAMRFLSGSDAVIIDLRDNGGGGGSVGSLLTSYFFDSGRVQLSGAYFRSSGTIEQSWTLPYVPGKRLPDVDLYILTSSRTFSAAEDFSYSLKALERARIVGEATKGGAHPVDVKIVKGDILTQISIGNSVNPITGGNWEGVGVKPDIEVPAENALVTAHRTALRSLLEKATDDELKRELTDLIEELE